MQEKLLQNIVRKCNVELHNNATKVVGTLFKHNDITVFLVEQNFHLVFDLLLECFLKPVDSCLVSKFSMHEGATAAAM